MKMTLLLAAMAVTGARELAIAEQNATGASQPAFEVASIRRNVEGGVPRTRVEGDRLIASNRALLELIRDAYQLETSQVVGGPEWRDPPPGANRAAPASQRPGQVTFDIIANIPPNTPAAQVPLMVRRLLADRFNLVVHTEMRDMPVYLLTYARADKKLGPQLTRSTQQCQAEIDGGPLRAPVTRVDPNGNPVCGMMLGRAIRGGGLPMKFLAYALGIPAGRIVVDRTGLEGPFDFEVRFGLLANAGISDDQPSVFVAVQEKLGLKLEPATAPVEVLVIDSVSMPNEN